MLQETITAEQALKRAFWRVKLPSMAILIVPLLAYAGLAKLNYVPSYGYAGMRLALPTLLFSFVGSWLVWSVQVPRWRLWAYRRVKDIEQLKELAIERQYIWPDGSIFEKTEIMSRKVRDELRKLEEVSKRGA
jgi:hypothetical protein